MRTQSRRFPIGAELTEQGASFRVWAPRRSAVTVVGESGGSKFEQPLDREKEGYFSAVVPHVKAGATYQFRLEGESNLFPDPASRFQPEGPHGPSMVVDPAAFQWNDAAWKGVQREGQVI